MSEPHIDLPILGIQVIDLKSLYVFLQLVARSAVGYAFFDHFASKGVKSAYSMAEIIVSGFYDYLVDVV